MGSEILQLGIVAAALVVVFVLWLVIVFLPGRTMENGWRRDDDEPRQPFDQ